MARPISRESEVTAKMPVPLFEPEADVAKTRRNLPHWKQEGKTYFLTFRLADSLPTAKRDQLKADREAWKASHGNKPASAMNPAERAEYYRLFHRRVEEWLDAAEGACVLRQGNAAAIVETALRHFDGKRYALGRLVVAANHVHVLVTPHAREDVSKILHSWKSFTANAINKALNRTGALWLDESFDHLVRTDAQLEKIEAYIRAHSRSGSGAEKPESG